MTQHLLTPTTVDGRFNGRVPRQSQHSYLGAGLFSLRRDLLYLTIISPRDKITCYLQLIYYVFQQCAGEAAELLKTITLTKENINQWAILESGATSNFLMMDAHITIINSNKQQISVTLPDGNKVKSTQKCLLNIPNLPHNTQIGYIVSGLASHSLISVLKLCDARCEITFTKIGVTIKH